MWLFFVFWIGKIEFIKWKKNNKKGCVVTNNTISYMDKREKE